MNRRRWMRWGAVGSVAAVALTGCVGEDEPAPSVVSPTAEVLTEEELTQDALDVANEFVALTDRAFTELELPAELYELTTDEIAANLAVEVEAYVEQGYRLEGNAVLLDVIATAVTVTSDDSGLVSLEGCLDTSGSQVIDSSGSPVSGGGSERRPVTFDIRWQNESGRVIATAFPGESGDPACA